MKISIIGAGPVGGYLASLLAKDHEVLLFEDHKEIGNPVQCTGLVTDSMNEIVELKNQFIINKIKRIRVIAPNKKSIELNLKNENIVLDRQKFDSYLVNQAVDKGIKLFFDHKFKDFSNNEITFENQNKFKTDILVGADGPFSKVAKSANLYGNRKFFIAPQAVVKGNFDKDIFEVYLGTGDFAWVVPENEEVARIGLVTKDKYEASIVFKNLLKRYREVLCYQSGLIPIHNPKIKTQKDNIYLMGDAACQTKANTHGGLIPGMIAAQEFKNSLNNGHSYDELWRKRIGKDLAIALKMRKILDKFNENDFNKLVGLCDKKKVKEILETYDRDFPSKFVAKLILAEPRFLKFSTKILFN